MSGEILNQAEIDALLKMIGDQVGGGWEPGEQEAMERVGALMAEAASVAWQSLGLEVRVSAPVVEQVTPSEAAAAIAGPGLWLAGRFRQASWGLLAFWVGGGAYQTLAGSVFGENPGDAEPDAGSMEQLGEAVGGFLAPLQAGLEELGGRPAELDPAGVEWCDRAAGERLERLLQGAERLVRFDFPCQVGSASGTFLAFWGLAEARAFLEGLAASGRAGGAAGGSAEVAAAGSAEVAAAGSPPAGSASGGSAAAAEEGAVAGSAAIAGAEEERRGIPVWGAQFAAFEPPSGGQVPRNMDLILDVPLTLTVELGRTEKQIREILSLGPGSVVELDRMAGEAVDVMVNGKLVARGEVIVVDDKFGVRITDVVSRAERLQKLR